MFQRQESGLNDVGGKPAQCQKRFEMKAGRSKMLLVTYGGGHAAVLAPVVKLLLQDDEVDVIVLGLTTAAQVYAKYGVTSRGYAHYLQGDPRRAHIEELGVMLVADVSSSAAGVPLEESRAYMGSCMADLIEEVGEVGAWQRYRAIGRHAFDPRGTIRRIISSERPDLIVATNSPKSERAALQVGTAMGINTVMVPDLFCHPDWGEMYSPFKADHFAVIAESARQNLITLHGISPAAISITGQPALDKASVPTRAACLDYIRQLQAHPAEGDFLLVVTSPDVHDAAYPAQGSADSEVAVGALLSGLPPSTRLVIKPHPSERRASWEALAKAWPRVFIAPPSSDINAFLRVATGLIAASSTTCVLDAFALQVPTIVCSAKRPLMRDVFPWKELAIPVVKEIEEIKSLGGLPAFLARIPSGQRAIREEFQRNNAHATRRVADLVTRHALAARATRGH